jgi:hypothetical protein
MTLDAHDLLGMQGLFEERADPCFDVGTKLVFEDGRIFRYAKAGDTGLNIGLIMQSPAIDANLYDQNIITTAAIGATSVAVTAGGAVVAHAYDGGYLVINDADGEGQCYRIKSHNVLAGSGTLTVQLFDPKGLTVGITATTTQATVIANPFNGLILPPDNTLTGTLVGVTPMAVTALYYFWLQTRGVCSCLYTAGASVITANIAGMNAIYCLGTEGSYTTPSAATCTTGCVGVSMYTTVGTEYNPMFLNMDQI